MTERAQHLKSLTGLRACAALLVFAGHSAVTARTEFALAQTSIAVSFFFVLSGFVLVWVGDEREPAGRFYRKRFARLYPAYAVTWLAGLVLSVSVGYGEPVLSALTGAGLLQAWVPAPSWYYGYNSVAWSLSCEAFFYLSFPFWAAPLVRTSSRTRLLLASGAFGLLVVGGVAAEAVSPYSAVVTWPDVSPSEWFIRVFPPMRTIEFFLGACLAVEMRQGRRFPIPLGVAIAVALPFYLLPGFIQARWEAVALPLLPLVAIVGAAAQADLDGRRTLFSSRTFVWAGGISYSFYLVHQLVIRAFEQLASDDKVWLTVAVALPLSVLISAALHYGVERPLNQRLRPAGAQPDPAAATSGATSL